MKRASQGGSSPDPKHSPFYQQDSDSEEFNFGIPSQPHSGQQDVSYTLGDITPSGSSHSIYQGEGDSLLPCSQQSDPELLPNLGLNDSPASQYTDWEASPSSSSSDDQDFEFHSNSKGLLNDLLGELGVNEAATAILENQELKAEITKRIFSSSHKSLKSALKDSRLTADKKDRAYLLTLSPRSLCDEFQSHSNPAFKLLVHGLLGISEEDQLFNSQFLINNVCSLYSTISKILNRQATGYALLLTTCARDGGLREDSIRLFASLVHPRTSQKYDKSVLCNGWDTKLKENLEREKSHFIAKMEAEDRIEELLQLHAADEVIDEAKKELDNIINTSPPQLQMVWDNLNLRTKHRYQRVGDNYEDANLDWMASLWIEDRIDANHMEHREGESLKNIDSLSIKDMVPTEKEKNYVFRALISYYSYRLVQRHPLLYQSIVRCIKPSKPHQFQQAMDSRSKEFTGNLFTLSESRTEDLITMMSEVQLNVHTFTDDEGVEHCYEKKIVSGDNKTEKNMTYGILRFDKVIF